MATRISTSEEENVLCSTCHGQPSLPSAAKGAVILLFHSHGDIFSHSSFCSKRSKRPCTTQNVKSDLKHYRQDNASDCLRHHHPLLFAPAGPANMTRRLWNNGTLDPENCACARRSGALVVAERAEGACSYYPSEELKLQQLQHIGSTKLAVQIWPSKLAVPLSVSLCLRNFFIAFST